MNRKVIVGILMVAIVAISLSILWFKGCFNDLENWFNAENPSNVNEVKVKGEAFQDYYISPVPIASMPEYYLNITVTNEGNNILAINYLEGIFMASEKNSLKITIEPSTDESKVLSLDETRNFEFETDGYTYDLIADFGKNNRKNLVFFLTIQLERSSVIVYTIVPQLADLPIVYSGESGYPLQFHDLAEKEPTKVKIS